VGNASARLDPERLLAESGWVRALAQSLVGAGDVDDVVQETWRVALERPPRLDGSSSNLRGWLATVMRNLVQRSRRGERMRADHAERVGRELSSSESDAHERVLLQRHLADAVLQLEEPYKSAIVSRYFDGLSPRQIAELQGISYDAARQRLSRGLGVLRARLDRDYGGERATWSALCLGLLRRKAALAAPSVVVGGVIVSVKSLSAAAAALVLIVASWWWLRGSSTGPSDTQTSAARPTDEFVASTPRGQDPSNSASDVRQSVPTGELVIDRDHDLHGIVLDPEGAPVIGASVAVLRNELCEISTLDPDHKFDCTTIAQATTSVRGEFAIALQPGRAFDLAVDAAGFAHANFEHCHAGERVEVHLERGSTLSGRVTRHADGAPLAGARIELGRSNTNDLRESTPRATATTDESGGYRLQRIASGEYIAWVFAADAVTGLEELSIAPASSIEHDFALDAGRTVSGRVLDALTSAPVANAEIDASSRFERSVRSNANGEFTCGRLSISADAALYVRAAGYGRTELALRQQEKLHPGELVEIRMQHGRIVRGRTIDAQGSPLASVYIAAVSYKQVAATGKVDWRSTRTGADGRFELSDVRADAPHVLWIKKDESATLAYTFPSNESELEVFDFGDIRVAGASTLRGVLVDENGAAYARHIVRLHGWNSDLGAFGGVDASHQLKRNEARVTKLPSQNQVLELFLGDRSTRTDDLGRFSFGDLGAGPYVLGASMRHAFHETTVPVQVAEATPVDDVKLVLQRGPTIEGRVVSSNGEPLYAIVSCFTTGSVQGNDGTCFTDARGHFVLEGLSPMAYCVAAVPEPRAGEPANRARWLQVTLRDIAAGTHDVELVCQRGGVITGTVVDANGDPVQWMQVSARGRGDPHNQGGAETDARGRFELNVPGDERYDIHARPLRPDPDGSGDMLPIPDNDPAHGAEVLDVAVDGPPIVIRMP
jgi:RNA polymerase sigma factor (sigma-70 family)